MAAIERPSIFNLRELIDGFQKLAGFETDDGGE
jgi:hypothetical protein